MKFSGLLVVLAPMFCVISGLVIEEGIGSFHVVIGESRKFGGKALPWPFCKNEASVYDNLIICLACKGFSRLCFTMTNIGGVPSIPSTIPQIYSSTSGKPSINSSTSGKPNVTSGSVFSTTKATSIASSGGEETPTESAKAI